jgi:hypothetical protein
MLNVTDQWTDQTIPYICWDRNWTVGHIRDLLKQKTGDDRYRLMAWLMRELKSFEVWYFLKPSEVYRDFDAIKRWLGPSKDMWENLFEVWHAMGRV